MKRLIAICILAGCAAIAAGQADKPLATRTTNLQASLESYLSSCGMVLSLHFTLELDPDAPHKNIHAPANKPKSLDEIIAFLAQELPEFAVLPSPTNPNILHVIQKSLLNNKTYEMNKPVTLQFTGTPAALLNQLTGKGPAVFEGGSPTRPISPLDTWSTVKVDVKQQPLREVLSNMLPLDSYNPVLWHTIATEFDGRYTIKMVFFILPRAADQIVKDRKAARQAAATQTTAATLPSQISTTNPAK